MNITRTIYLIRTYPIRYAHRRGFGIQSPWAYELVRDVLFEPLQYYAYKEQGLKKPLDQQLYRIRNHYRNNLIIHITEEGNEASLRYNQAIVQALPNNSIIIIEHIDDVNAPLWNKIVSDQRATITFDMRQRGMVVIDTKRIKQNYLL